MELALALLSNRLSQLAIALGVGWFSGYWWESQRWTDAVAKEKAALVYAHQVELARQQQAASDIAAEATQRLVEEQSAESEMQKQIDELKRREENAKDCLVDDDFLKRLRDIDAAARKASPARRPR